MIQSECAIHATHSAASRSTRPPSSRRPFFSQGSVSVMAHSLGSVLCYEILCNQGPAQALQDLLSGEAPAPPAKAPLDMSLEECVGTSECRGVKGRAGQVSNILPAWARAEPSHRYNVSPIPSPTGCGTRSSACDRRRARARPRCASLPSASPQTCFYSLVSWYGSWGC